MWNIQHMPVRDITWMSDWFVHLTKCSLTPVLDLMDLIGPKQPNS